MVALHTLFEYNFFKYFSEFGGYSPEIENVITAGTTGFICGTFMGAMGASKSEYINFIDKNKTSVFESHFHAKVFHMIFFLL